MHNYVWPHIYYRNPVDNLLVAIHAQGVFHLNTWKMKTHFSLECTMVNVLLRRCCVQRKLISAANRTIQKRKPISKRVYATVARQTSAHSPQAQSPSNVGSSLVRARSPRRASCTWVCWSPCIGWLSIEECRQTDPGNKGQVLRRRGLVHCQAELLPAKYQCLPRGRHSGKGHTQR